MEPTWIAEESVVFVYPDGRRITGRIAVGLPARVSDVEAHCLIALDGIDHKAVPVMGGSPLQALVLGLQIIGSRLYDFRAHGGRVLYPTGESDMLDGLFGSLLRPTINNRSDEQ